MAKKGRKVGHECKTSGVVVEKTAEYIETDECIKACGIDRKAIGISSDTLFDPLGFSICFVQQLDTTGALTLLSFTSTWLLEKEYSYLIDEKNNVPILTVPWKNFRVMVMPLHMPLVLFRKNIHEESFILHFPLVPYSHACCMVLLWNVSSKEFWRRFVGLMKRNP